LAITNAPGSALSQVADLALVTEAGPELAVPATKTFTTQLAAMVVLAGALMARLSAVLDAESDRVPNAVAELIRQRWGVRDAVEALLSRSQLFCQRSRPHFCRSQRSWL
jgi:glucosamine--fructose-6-phosphate aminotransferase (isomerizing)